MYKKGRGLMKQLYEDQVLLFEDQDLIAEEYAEIQERKMILGQNESRFYVSRNHLFRFDQKQFPQLPNGIGFFHQKCRKKCSILGEARWPIPRCNKTNVCWILPEDSVSCRSHTMYCKVHLRSKGSVYWFTVRLSFKRSMG